MRPAGVIAGYWLCPQGLHLGGCEFSSRSLSALVWGHGLRLQEFGSAVFTCRGLRAQSPSARFGGAAFNVQGFGRNHHGAEGPGGATSWDAGGKSRL